MREVAKDVRISPEEARAYAMAVELQVLLEKLCQLPQNGRGSCLEAAWDGMDEVILMLEPEEPSPGLDYVPICRLREISSQD